MLPFPDDKDFRERRKVLARHFCHPPDTSSAKPLQIHDVVGLTELSFALFAGWLFSGILNRGKPLLRPCLMPVGANGESSILSLYDPGSHLATPGRKTHSLLSPSYFKCPLDTADRVLTDRERHLCPVVNKLRYNLAHSKPEWNVDGLDEPSKTKECCESKKALLWSYLDRTLVQDPDKYGSIVGGAAYPIALRFELLKEYLTGITSDTKDLGKLLEETLLCYAMSRSEVLLGGAHTSFPKPFECYEIDILLYECSGKYKQQKTEPEGGWKGYLGDQSICVIELTIGHRASDFEEGGAVDAKSTQVDGNDAPKNKLINYFALSSYGFKRVEANYISFIRDKTMHAATRQALESTPGYKYVLIEDSDAEGRDIEQMVLSHHDDHVSVATVRKWHSQLIKAVEDIAQTFAQGVQKDKPVASAK